MVEFLITDGIAYERVNGEKKAQKCSSVVECLISLISMHKALGLIPSTTITKKQI
jgi:hypothetical protein